mgnify:CR=1 FL=1
MKKSILLIPMMLLGMAVTFSPALAADEEKGEIVFADVGWDSIKLNNAIAGLIAEEVFGPGPRFPARRPSLTRL